MEAKRRRIESKAQLSGSKSSSSFIAVVVANLNLNC